jgi:hypothetical protein
MKRSKLYSVLRISGAIIVLLALWALLSPGVSHAGGASSPTAGAWTYTGNMNTGRSNYTATRLNDGRVLVAGGAGTQGSTELYDPDTGQWTPAGSLNLTRYQHTATLLPDGTVLVAGGACMAPCTSPGTSAEIFDPSTGVWTPAGNMSSGHNLHAAVLLNNGKVLVAGGYAGGTASASAEIFDPVTGTWSSTGNLHTARMRHTATVLPDGKVLVVGGHNSSGALASAELYNPSNGIWTKTKSMSVARVWHIAILLNNGKVLVAGGCSSSATSSCAVVHASAELYTPSNAKWSATGSMVNARHWFPGALLPGGTALVSGGWGPGLVYLANAEVYDPLTGTWSATASMNATRKSHTLTVLQDGRVLAAGGVDGITTLSSAELYANTP